MSCQKPSNVLRRRGGTQQIVKHVAGINACHCLIDTRGLRLKVVYGGFVVLGSLCIRVELAVGVRHGEVGLLYGSIQQIAAVQLGPWSKCVLKLAEGSISPTNAQQCASRVGASNTN